MAMGKDSFIERFEVSETKSTVDLGIIILKDGSKELEEVTVTATRPLISMEVDRIAYDVQADGRYCGGDPCSNHDGNLTAGKK